MAEKVDLKTAMKCNRHVANFFTGKRKVRLSCRNLDPTRRIILKFSFVKRQVSCGPRHMTRSWSGSMNRGMCWGSACWVSVDFAKTIRWTLNLSLVSNSVNAL